MNTVFVIMAAVVLIALAVGLSQVYFGDEELTTDHPSLYEQVKEVDLEDEDIERELTSENESHEEPDEDEEKPDEQDEKDPVPIAEFQFQKVDRIGPERARRIGDFIANESIATVGQLLERDLTDLPGIGSSIEGPLREALEDATNN